MQHLSKRLKFGIAGGLFAIAVAFHSMWHGCMHRHESMLFHNRRHPETGQPQPYTRCMDCGSWREYDPRRMKPVGHWKREAVIKRSELLLEL